MLNRNTWAGSMQFFRRPISGQSRDSISRFWDNRATRPDCQWRSRERQVCALRTRIIEKHHGCPDVFHNLGSTSHGTWASDQKYGGTFWDADPLSGSTLNGRWLHPLCKSGAIAMADQPNPNIRTNPVPFRHPLSRLAEQVSGSGPIKIVAIGSSTTAGEGGVVASPIWMIRQGR